MANITKTSSRGRRGLVYHLEFPNGKSVKVEGRSAQEVTAQGIKEAQKRGYDFRKGSDVTIWEKV
jgi:hypothetical protein